MSVVHTDAFRIILPDRYAENVTENDLEDIRQKSYVSGLTRQKNAGDKTLDKKTFRNI
jgi:hypothetical protein